MALLKLRRHTYFLNCATIAVVPISSGRFAVTVNDADTFTVIGGRASGGSAREWFCHCPRLYGDAWVPATSMIAAIRLGVNG